MKFDLDESFRKHGIPDLLMYIFAVLAGGLMLQCFWGWFVVPIGLPAIGMAQAAGMVILVRYARGKPQGAYTKPDARPIDLYTDRVLGYVVAFIAGFIAHWYMHH